MLSQQVHAVPCIRNSPTHIVMELLGIKHEKDVYVSQLHSIVSYYVIEIPTILVKQCRILAETALNASQKIGKVTLNRK